jgi:hypothetical protein
MTEIVKAAGGSKTRLSAVFDAEAMRAFNTAITEYNNTGAIQSLEKFLNMQADGNAILRDSARIATTSAGAARFLKSAWVQFADANLTQPINDLATTLTNLDPDEVQRYFGMAANGVKVLAGAIIATKLVGFVANITTGLSSLKNLTGKGGVAGAAANLTPIPVFVVNGMGANWRGALGSIAGGAAAGTALAGGTGGVVTSAWKMLKNQPMGNLARMGPGVILRALGFYVGLAGTGGYAAGKYLINPLLPDSFKNSMGELIAQSLALFGNDNAQNALHSNKVSERIALFEQFKAENPQSAVSLRIVLDQDGRIRDSYMDGNSNMEVDLQSLVGGYN